MFHRTLLLAILTPVDKTAASFLGSSRVSFAKRSFSTHRFMEVEQKFQLNKTTDLDSKLKSLGFNSRGTVKIVDWYFDTPANDLSTRDFWLRYRETSDLGQWELKMGKSASQGQDATTVYEEIEGEKACATAMNILSENSIEPNAITLQDFEGLRTPDLPSGTQGLIPFCRLETTRSSWTPNSEENKYLGLQVDLDATNTGHTVGEVEAIADEGEIETAKQRVQQLISILTGADEDPKVPAIGKLEHFLMNFRPEHYAACVASGVIKERIQ